MLVNCKGCVDGMMHVVHAAPEWQPAKLECVGATPAFEVRSPALVEQALVTEKSFNIASGGTSDPGSDPHKGLEDVRLESLHMLLIQHVHGEPRNWGVLAGAAQAQSNLSESGET
jgi:hypothetical protein